MGNVDSEPVKPQYNRTGEKEKCAHHAFGAMDTALKQGISEGLEKSSKSQQGQSAQSMRCQAVEKTFQELLLLQLLPDYPRS